MEVLTSAGLATALLPIATNMLINKKGMGHMKEIVLVIGLVMLSMNALADEASIQMVLDSVHGKGFAACDSKIREELKYETGISHVETKMPFGLGFGNNAVAINDEVVVVYSKPGNSQYDWEESVQSLMIRNVGKECVTSRGFIINSSSTRGCKEVSQVVDKSFVLVAKADASYWMRHGDSDPGWDARFQREGTRTIFTTLSNGACRLIGLPDDWSDKQKKK
jgi:hypothetical protein